MSESFEQARIEVLEDEVQKYKKALEDLRIEFKKFDKAQKQPTDMGIKYLIQHLTQVLEDNSDA